MDPRFLLSIELFMGSFVGHDGEDELVGLAHGFAADGGEIVDRAVDVVADNTLNFRYAFAIHSKHRRHQGR